MKPGKLEALRKKYSSGGALASEPRFKRVFDYQFSPAGTRTLPYAGVPTLLDAPFAESLAGLDIALIGVPMDLGVTNRSGARFGPRAVRGMERIGPYNHVLDVLPFAARRCADIGDVPFRSRFSLESCIEDIEAFYREVVDAGVMPLSVGGDHSVTHPILKALGRDVPLGCLHIDAHCDTSGEYEGANSSTVRRFAMPFWTASWIPNAPSRSAFAATRSTSGILLRIGDDGDSRRDVCRNGGRRGHFEGP